MLSHRRRLVSVVSAAVAARVPSATVNPSWRRGAHAAAAGYASDEAFAGGVLLAWGLVGVLAHLWLQPLVPLI